MADKFIILNNVQFTKNGYQNRYQLSNGNWITKSVTSGTELIKYKKYTSGRNLSDLNMQWIETIKNTLEIDTDIYFGSYNKEDSATMRLIKEIKNVDGDVYITNPDAKNKYLEEDLIKANGIEIEYCKVPKHLQKHTFEVFEQFGIDGAIKQLPNRNRNLCKV